MKISYAITVCNELEEIQQLIPFLYETIREEDEIVVLLDTPKASLELLSQLRYWHSKETINLKESIFQGHFADWKNELNALCSGDWIFQIDADEYPNIHLIESLSFVLENNEADIILVPRVNTVKGINDQVCLYPNFFSPNANKSPLIATQNILNTIKALKPN
jgi:hypothetical protein